MKRAILSGLVAIAMGLNIAQATPYEQIKTEVESHENWTIRGNSDEPQIYLLPEQHEIARSFSEERPIIEAITEYIPNFGLESCMYGDTNALESFANEMTKQKLAEETLLSTNVTFTAKDAIDQSEYIKFLVEKGVNLYGIENRDLWREEGNIGELVRVLQLRATGSISEKLATEATKEYLQEFDNIPPPNREESMLDYCIRLMKKEYELIDKRTIAATDNIEKLGIYPIAVKFGMKHMDEFEEEFQKRNIPYAVIFNERIYKVIQKQEQLMENNLK